MLGDLQEVLEDTAKFHGMPPFIATDYTIESIMAMMCDTNGTALLILDEMKKIKAVDEYKGGKQGSGNEKLMELQGGVRFRQIRKGGGGNKGDTSRDEDATDSSEEQLKSSVKVFEAKSHLNICGCTHMHTGTAWFKVRHLLTPCC